MPKGFRRAKPETAEAKAFRKFRDRRSYYAWRAPDRNTLHLILFGEDKSAQRPLIYAQSGGMCEGSKVDPSHGEHEITPQGFTWHHAWDGDNPRCDCTHNAMAVCGYFHEEVEHGKRSHALKKLCIQYCKEREARRAASC